MVGFDLSRWKWVTVVAGSVLIITTLVSCASPSEPATNATGNQSDAQIVQDATEKAWLEVLALDSDAIRPQVELVRLVSLDEWAAVTVSCLDNQGFQNVTVDASGQGIVVEDVADSQRSSYQLALYTCAAKYPFDPKYNRPLDEAQLTKLYNYYVDELPTCLRGLGYETSQAPSLQNFIDSYASDPWLPWVEASLQAAPAGPDATSELERQCPQLPPDLW